MRICPRCGEENPDRARFCLQCGEHLSDPGPGRSQRKFATALFADLVGTTSLIEREDPEVVQFVVSRAFDRLAEEIRRLRSSPTLRSLILAPQSSSSTSWSSA